MNISEFARRASVSTATVSRAFHEPEKLRPDTRDKVLSLAQRLGYYPSPSGRVLKTGRYDVIGLIWPLEVEGARAEFAQRVLAELTTQLVANDLDLLVCPVKRDDPATLAHARRTLQRSRCDAWILLYPRQDDALIPFLESSRKPVVCLMGALPESPSWKCVRLNQRSWIEDALQRLKASGCQSVSLYGSRPGEPDHEERHRAFAELAPEYFGKQVARFPGWLPDAGCFRRHLAASTGEGVIGVDDRAALAALEAARSLRPSFPRQLKVVGIDDISEARFSTPSLSSYRQPLDEMAQCAVELALGTRKRSRLFEATFVPRTSLPDHGR